MTTDDQIKDEKLQYDIYREAVKISALSSGKVDKYELKIVNNKLIIMQIIIKMKY